MPKLKAETSKGMKLDIARGMAKEEVAEKWHVHERTVTRMIQDQRSELMEIRGMLAHRNATLIHRAQDEVLIDLEDKDKMAATPLKDKAQTLKYVSDSLVSLAEGQQPGTIINFGEIIQAVTQVQNIMGDSERILENVRTKVILSTPLPEDPGVARDPKSERGGELLAERAVRG